MAFSISSQPIISPNTPPIIKQRKLQNMPPIETYEILDSGPPISINDATRNTQTDSVISILDNQRSVISWTSNAQDARYNTIATKTFNPMLQDGSEETTLNLYGTDTAQHPRTTSLPDNNYALITDDSNDVYLRIFNQSMFQIKEPIQVNTQTSSDQEYPDLTASNEGNIFTAWDSSYQDGSLDGIYSDFFDSEGLPISTEFRINTATTNQQEQPSITLLSNTNLAYAWNCQDGSLFGVCGKIIDQNKNVKTSEYTINSHTSSSQEKVRQTALNDKFAATWIDKDQLHIYVKLISNTGTILSNDIQVSSNQDQIDVNSRPDIATLSNGDGFVISYGTVNNYEYGVSLQVFNNNGEKVGTTIQVNDAPLSYATKPSIAVQTDGTFIVAYTGDDSDGSGIVAKTFTPIQTTSPSSNPTHTPPTGTPTSSSPTLDPTSSAPTLNPSSSYPSNWPTFNPSFKPSSSSPTTSWPSLSPSLSQAPTITSVNDSNGGGQTSSIELGYIILLSIVGVGLTATSLYFLYRCINSCFKSEENESARHQTSHSRNLELEPYRDPRENAFQYTPETNPHYTQPSAPPLVVAQVIGVDSKNQKTIFEAPPSYEEATNRYRPVDPNKYHEEDNPNQF